MTGNSERPYSVYSVLYRPVVFSNPIFLLAVLVVMEPAGQLLSSKKLANWKPLLDLHPDADIDLLSEIVAEIELNASRNPSFLGTTSGWGNLIEVTKTTVLSSELPSSLAEGLFQASWLKNGLANDQEI